MARWQAGLCLIYGTASLLDAAVEVRRTPQAGSQSSQFFGRGFELNLGTDFALACWGIPLNTPSHVRGPGWLDQDLVIPELVEGFQYWKGPYRAEQGPFAVAGSATMAMVRNLPEPMIAMTYGGASADRFARLLWAETLPGPKVTYALDVTRSGRPWQDPMGSARFNGALRKDGEGPLGPWSFTLLGSVDKSDTGGATPVRPFPPGTSATLDDAKAGDGTWNQRLLFGWRLEREEAPGVTTRIGLYGGGHHQRLWNNWTYFLRDQQHGDQLELVDRRLFLGGDWTRVWERQQGAVRWTHTLGVQARVDRVSAAQAHPTLDRNRLGPPLLGARAGLVHGAVFGQSTAGWASGWEAFLGWRLDTQVNHATRTAGDWLPQDRGQTLGSPKAGVSYSPVEGTTFSLQAGQGFRLGDAFRETQPMVRARSVELAAQTRPLDFWVTSLTLWRLDLENESLFDPALNAFTGRGPARHQGLEWYHQLSHGPWALELAWGWNRAVFKDLPHGQDLVPGAIPHTGYVGAAWKEGGTSLELRLRRTGARPLTGDNQVAADRQDALEFRVQQDFGAWSVAFEVLNAFSLKTYNSEYYYVSRFPGEAGAGVPGRSLKPADPQSIRLEVRRRF